MADEITCLIADDHEVVREGLRLALSRSPKIRVIGEAADGASAVALTERRRPDVVIMDLRMPDMDGLEATETLLERVPGTAVLIFTAYGERSLLQRGLESGARGYILKEAPHETLLRAIEKVAARFPAGGEEPVLGGAAAPGTKVSCGASVPGGGLPTGTEPSALATRITPLSVPFPSLPKW